MTKKQKPADLWFSEQLEAIAIAIAMALVLKFFIVEAYQIPSGSMQPTIIGDSASGIKDRILADKLVTMIRDPRRWEVMIFRFPLDERRLYVKRIVGLPGETMDILGGDVFIDGAIARKPDHVLDSVLKDVFTRGADGIDIGRAFSPEAGVSIQDTSATFPAEGQGWLSLRHPVRDVYTHGYDPAWGITGPAVAQYSVSDLEMSLTARLGTTAQSMEIVLGSDEGDFIFQIPAEGSSLPAQLTFQPEPTRQPQVLFSDPGLFIPRDRSVEVVARDVDRRTVLTVNGEEWLRIDNDAAGPRALRPHRATVKLGVVGGGQVSDLRLRRDIWYLPRGPGSWAIPEDHYFGLGDNTQGSLDSRTWETMTYPTADGPVSGFWFYSKPGNPIRSDSNPKDLPGGRILFADVHGNEHILQRRSYDGDTNWAPFIPGKFILGKAVAVFWPIFDPFRWKLIH
ncbi:MAG: signal peptidase I [Planctomycetota bacterium]|nr:signal peptidase I [Planctomycetota bacterium]